MNAFAASLRGPGLATVLDTTDFGCWHESVAVTLGHHRSRLLTTGKGFEAHMRIAQAEGLGVLHLCGKGQLDLLREQCEHAVLWLPIRGISEELVNGEPWLAERGTALLFRPGDQLHGRTSPELEGISILIPAQELPLLETSLPTLLNLGRGHQAVLAAARDLATAAAQNLLGTSWAAEQLLNNLTIWACQHGPDAPRERITAVRRRAMVRQAREWLDAHLSERITVRELSSALGVSTRQLQYSFQEELGCSPMAEAKRLRLHRLRQLLQEPSLVSTSVAELMNRAGLLASGVTAADYRGWFGELPRQTRQAQPFFSQDLRPGNILS